MENFELVSAVMTGLFIAIGSLVFYVAFLISGRNPHRDESPTQATWMTIFTGVLLLFFTPIGYIIWQPALFPDDIPAANVSSPNDLGTYFQQITETLITSGLPPFILGALGLGLTVGSLLLLKGRERTLRSIRNKTGMGIAIRNYIKPWEQLLSAVKSKGYLCVRTKDKTFIAGHIDFVSTGEEADALALRDPHVLPRAPGEFSETDSAPADAGSPPQLENRNREQTGDSQTSEVSAIGPSVEPISETLDQFIAQNPCRRDVTVVGEHSEIREIQIPHYSFQTNFNSLDHPSLGFFTAVSAIGILLMALSGFLTANFLGGYQEYLHMSWAYAAIAWVLVTITGILSVVAIWTGKRDNARLRSAFIFTPAPFLLALTALLAAGVTAVVFLNLFLSPGLPQQVLLALGTIGAIYLLTIIHLGIAVRWKRHSLGEFLQEQLTAAHYPGHLNYEKLRALLTMLYLRCDFNYHDSTVAYRQATKALKARLPSVPAHQNDTNERERYEMHQTHRHDEKTGAGEIAISREVHITNNNTKNESPQNSHSSDEQYIVSREQADQFFTALRKMTNKDHWLRNEEVNMVRFLYWYLDQHVPPDAHADSV